MYHWYRGLHISNSLFNRDTRANFQPHFISPPLTKVSASATVFFVFCFDKCHWLVHMEKALFANLKKHKFMLMFYNGN